MMTIEEHIAELLTLDIPEEDVVMVPIDNELVGKVHHCYHTGTDLRVVGSACLVEGIKVHINLPRLRQEAQAIRDARDWQAITRLGLGPN